ncbi:hypothetical protein F511_23076 [Dorcoceras hygrometricum]|uniref:Uncharacterized protein n=1 Tax=Dorcoceras hygrometricum TaxID=472368 RepID=A0A2Z7A976_9LAMI|nr:hypothetical protein F511_23076 [Dorcoceras hygrometricum]
MDSNICGIPNHVFFVLLPFLAIAASALPENPCEKSSLQLSSCSPSGFSLHRALETRGEGAIVANS